MSWVQQYLLELRTAVNRGQQFSVTRYINMLHKTLHLWLFPMLKFFHIASSISLMV